MWMKFAKRMKGFVLALDTTCLAFRQFAEGTMLGKVRYTDEPLPFFLDDVNASSFYQKRTRFEYESEWRLLRRLDLLTRGTDHVFLHVFDPSLIKQILYLPTCEVLGQLHALKGKDDRYQGADMVLCEEPRAVESK